MAKILKRIITSIDKDTGKYEKLSIKAPKGQRKFAINQDNKIIIYDDKGNVVGYI